MGALLLLKTATAIVPTVRRARRITPQTRQSDERSTSLQDYRKW
jgi:hypothetical protein